MFTLTCAIVDWGDTSTDPINNIPKKTFFIGQPPLHCYILTDTEKDL
jgi:hypothetical protein